MGGRACVSIAGFCEYSFRLAWVGVFHRAFAFCHFRRKQAVLQQVLRARTAFRTVGKQTVAAAAAAGAPADEGLPLWIFCLLHADVLQYAVYDIPCLYRRSGAAPGRHRPLECAAVLAVGISGRSCTMGRTVCLRLLQRDAHFGNHRTGADAADQAACMVRNLSDGKHDAGNLQIKKRCSLKAPGCTRLLSIKVN